MSRLKIVPEARRMFKITLWLDPTEYYSLMKASSELEAGKISMHKLFKAKFGLDTDKKKPAPTRSINNLIRHMRVQPGESEKNAQAQAIAARRVRRPRRLAA